MLKRKTALAAGALVVGLSTVALAAGLYTNGLPTIGSQIPNAVTAKAPNGVITQLPATGTGNAGGADVQPMSPLVPVDTGLQGGAAPQTVAASPFQIAATFAEVGQNTATSTVHAATLNTLGGLITTESLSTAVAAIYTFTLTNSLITAAEPPVQVGIFSKSNTGGHLTLTSVTNAAGSTVFVWTNDGTTALNGTMMIAFHL